MVNSHTRIDFSHSHQIRRLILAPWHSQLRVEFMFDSVCDDRKVKRTHENIRWRDAVEGGWKFGARNRNPKISNPSLPPSKPLPWLNLSNLWSGYLLPLQCFFPLAKMPCTYIVRIFLLPHKKNEGFAKLVLRFKEISRMYVSLWV